jgi:hypothetical protein
MEYADLEAARKKMTLMKAHEWFRKFFGEPLNPYLDGEMMLCFHRPMLDLDKFDQMLHKRHGEYEKQGLSMKDLLEKEYSAKAVGFVMLII